MPPENKRYRAQLRVRITCDCECGGCQRNAGMCQLIKLDLNSSIRPLIHCSISFLRATLVIHKHDELL